MDVDAEGAGEAVWEWLAQLAQLARRACRMMCMYYDVVDYSVEAVSALPGIWQSPVVTRWWLRAEISLPRAVFAMFRLLLEWLDAGTPALLSPVVLCCMSASCLPLFVVELVLMKWVFLSHILLKNEHCCATYCVLHR
jgi:hypothetical protein